YVGSLKSIKHASYREKILRTGHGSHVKLAFFSAGDQGNTHMALLTAAIIHELHPKLVALVGIAAGMEDVNKIGDVYVPRLIVDFTVTRQVRVPAVPVNEQGLPDADATAAAWKTIFRNHTRTRSLPDIVLGGQHVLPATPERRQVICKTANEILSDIYPTPLGTIAGLTQEEASAFISEHVNSAVLEIKDGHIASSNVLIRDPGLLKELAKETYGVEGGDMESAGLATACEATDTPWIVFRGISDFGDSRKSDDFQALAASRAAATFWSFVMHKFDVARMTKAEHWHSRRRLRLQELNRTTLHVFNAFANIMRAVHKEEVNIQVYWKAKRVAKDGTLVTGVLRDLIPLDNDIRFSVRRNNHQSLARSGFHALGKSQSLVAKAAFTKLEQYEDVRCGLSHESLVWVLATPVLDRSSYGVTVSAVLCMTSKSKHLVNMCPKQIDSFRLSVKSFGGEQKNIIEPLFEYYEVLKWTEDMRIMWDPSID
ncbi:MAG: hypothetical protein U1A72_22960, partial [Sulfuritalea sp.]|nr:hypothetical protein [Sulfuritalea sp.]